jgi:hypothetical protein
VANLVHRNDVEFPAFQGADRSVEKPGRDFVRFQWLKTSRTTRANALEPQDDAGTAPLQPCTTAEISEFQFQVCQQSGVGRQRFASQRV